MSPASDVSYSGESDSLSSRASLSESDFRRYSLIKNSRSPTEGHSTSGHSTSSDSESSHRITKRKTTGQIDSDPDSEQDPPRQPTGIPLPASPTHGGSWRDVPPGIYFQPHDRAGRKGDEDEEEDPAVEEVEEDEEVEGDEDVSGAEGKLKAQKERRKGKSHITKNSETDFDSEGALGGF